MSKLIALFYRGLYLYGKLDETGNFTSAKEFQKFPSTNICNLATIESFNIPNLGYEIKEGELNIFDKSKEEYISYTLPIYIKCFGELTPTIKKIKVTFPSIESYEAACKMYQIVASEYTKFDLKEEREQIYSLINKGNGLAYVRHSDFPHLNPIVFNDKNLHILFNYYHDSYILGTKATTKELTLKVPESLVGKVVGKGGKNVKEMAKCLGASYIKVIPM